MKRLSDLIDLHAFTLLFVGLGMTASGVVMYVWFPTVEALVGWRGGLIVSVVALWLLRLLFEGARPYYKYLISGLMVATAVFAHALLVASHYHPFAVVMHPLYFISTILCLQRPRFLYGYVIFFTILTGLSAGLVAEPEFPAGALVALQAVLSGFVLMIVSLVYHHKRQLTYRHDRLEALMTHVNEVYFLLDCRGHVTGLNRRAVDFAANIWHRKVKEGDVLATAMHYCKLPNFEANYESALHGQTTVEEIRVLDLQRHTRCYEVRYAPEVSADGQVNGVVLSATDITERERSRTMLRQKNEELKKTNFELDHFVYSAAHDLRAPLTSVMGLVNVIRLHNQSQETETYLGLIEKSMQRLDRFVKDIITYSRNARTVIEQKPVLVRALLQRIIEEHQFMPKAADVVAFVNIQGEEIPFYSDEKRVADILRNLLANAIRFADHHKQQAFVQIDLHIFADYVRVRVEDNGQGISKQHLGKVFDMFYRASENSQGAGLGLYIVRETVQRLNGEIRVESELGRGSTFELMLPNYSGPREAVEETPAPLAEPSHLPERVAEPRAKSYVVA